LGESNYFSITDGVFTRKISFGTLKNLITADGNESNALRFKELGDKISASESLLKSEDSKLSAKINELGTSFGSFANTTNNTFENVNIALNSLKSRDDELLAGLNAQKSHDHDIFTSSGPNTKKGFVPPPDKVAGTTKYLREDGKWVVPPDTKLELGTTATTAAKGDHSHSIVNRARGLNPRTTDGGYYGEDNYDIQAVFNRKGDGYFGLHVTSGGDGANYIDKVSVGKAYLAERASAVSAVAPVGGEHVLVYSDMAANDQFRILTGGASNGGYVCFDTADDGTEPFIFRQFTGVFVNEIRRAVILNADGNTEFPGDVYSRGKKIPRSLSGLG